MNAFHWHGGSSFATLPENYHFQTKEFKAFNFARRENPDTTPDWETWKAEGSKPKKRGRTKKEKVLISLMDSKEQAFNRKMEALAREAAKVDHFNVPIMSREESDRTASIRGAAC